MSHLTQCLDDIRPLDQRPRRWARVLPRCLIIAGAMAVADVAIALFHGAPVAAQQMVTMTSAMPTLGLPAAGANRQRWPALAGARLLPYFAASAFSTALTNCPPVGTTLLS